MVNLIIGVIEARHLKKFYNERKDPNLHPNHKNKEQPIKPDNDDGIQSRFSRLRKNPYIAGFSFIFLMELGDKTQLLTITLASIYPYPLEVWLGAFLALISLAWMGVFFGGIVAQKIPKFYLKLVTVVIFIFIGVVILITSI